MTRKQMALIFAANAVVSVLISLIVVVGAAFLLKDRFGAAPATETSQAVVPTATQAAAASLPSATPVIHVVQPGDTLTGLALQYDVPAEDILAANQLENPNFLQVGMELIIPVGGVPQVTPTLTPMPTPTNTPIPFEPPSAGLTATAAALAGATATSLPTPLPSTGELRIEITQVIAPGQIAQEAVVITNQGSRLVDMAGWTLSDALGNTYTFPNLRLWAGGSVTVNSGVGQDGSPPSSLYWGKLEAVWSPGEKVTLKDAAGQVVATGVVGP